MEIAQSLEEGMAVEPSRAYSTSKFSTAEFLRQVIPSGIATRRSHAPTAAFRTSTARSTWFLVREDPRDLGRELKNCDQPDDASKALPKLPVRLDYKHLLHPFKMKYERARIRPIP
ncbi:hypothetical protein CMUS01_16515 [Colletotrichum musicola]|uniref:Uncharacterized protein n=1 Tax=Colletotrichum musicola TaxID=2175873 RepID=A0A8H6IMW1_9PEZI|nr:hypothetical protein CMUS01_16515 [Colletotrichum musicola]